MGGPTGSAPFTVFCHDTGTDVWFRGDTECSLSADYILFNLFASSNELRPFFFKEDSETIRAVVQEEPALVQVVKICLNRFKPVAPVQYTLVNYSRLKPNGNALNMRIALCTNDVVFENGILREVPNSAINPAIPFELLSYSLRPKNVDSSGACGGSYVSFCQKFNPDNRFIGWLNLPRFINIQIMLESTLHMARRMVYCVWSPPAEVIKPKKELNDEVEQIVRRTEVLLLNDIKRNQQQPQQQQQQRRQQQQQQQHQQHQQQQEQQEEEESAIPPRKLLSQMPGYMSLDDKDDRISASTDKVDSGKQSPTKPTIFPLVFHAPSTSLLVDQHSQDTSPHSTTTSHSSSSSCTPSTSNDTFPRIGTFIPSHSTGSSAQSAVRRELQRHKKPGERGEVPKPTFFASIVGVLANRKANEMRNISSTPSSSRTSASGSNRRPRTTQTSTTGKNL